LWFENLHLAIFVPVIGDKNLFEDCDTANLEIKLIVAKRNDSKMKRSEARMIAEELKRLQDADEPYMDIRQAAEYLSLSVRFLEVHKEIPCTYIYPTNADGHRSKKPIVRYQKHKLAEFLRKMSC
jgi:hypothetical protein